MICGRLRVLNWLITWRPPMKQFITTSKTFEQALCSARAVLLSVADIFLIKPRGLILPYQDGSFVVVLLEVYSSSRGVF